MPITTYDFIDSATDAGEGWNTFGSQERGVLPIMYPDEASGFGALASEPQTFRMFSPADQHQILEEIEDNPSFGNKLKAWLHHPDGARLISESAKRAILNELYPKEHPETKGEWVTLRKRFTNLLRDLPIAVNQKIATFTPAQRIAIVRRMAEGGHIDIGLGATAPATTAPAAGGGDIWGGLIGGIASAAGSIFAAKITADSQKDVAKIQAQSVAAQNAATAQIAANQAAIDAARAKAGGMVVDPVTGKVISGGGGFPLWILPVGLGVVGLALFFFLR